MSPSSSWRSKALAQPLVPCSTLASKEDHPSWRPQWWAWGRRRCREGSSSPPGCKGMLCPEPQLPWMPLALQGWPRLGRPSQAIRDHLSLRLAGQVGQWLEGSALPFQLVFPSGGWMGSDPAHSGAPPPHPACLLPGPLGSSPWGAFSLPCSIPPAFGPLGQAATGACCPAPS